ncbi:MAG: hypothetical protein Q7J20_08655 [Candidatus Nitrotoga sp.]|nr:hypothetical protein [Candidatus Nitrotoga sp.]MDO9447944.1 hypothetical protein [Candidatus Nitrotoga sp.]
MAPSIPLTKTVLAKAASGKSSSMAAKQRKRFIVSFLDNFGIAFQYMFIVLCALYAYWRKRTICLNIFRHRCWICLRQRDFQFGDP